MKLSPSQVKNQMCRGLRLLLDPDPERTDRLRAYEFFDYRCAYCGAKLEIEEGDLDHLISAATGGSNHISNRVLSCKPCNAREKREMAWKDFLKKKCPGEQVLAYRQLKIEEWVNLCGGIRTLPEETLRLLKYECERVKVEYDVACRNIRNIRGV
jgi:hypothetical protein